MLMAAAPAKANSVSTSKLRLLPWLVIGALLIAADQASKYWITQRLSYQETMVIIERFLDFTLTHNKGAAFSFLHNSSWGHWIFVSIASAAAIGIPIWLRNLQRAQWLLATALMLIWSGAVGNLIDRLRFQYVIDFVAVHYDDVWAFAIFNVADAAISVGAVLLISYELFFAKKLEAKLAASQPSS
jgi:signal peptidase II